MLSKRNWEPVNQLLRKTKQNKTKLHFCLRVKFILNSIFLLFIYLYLFYKYYLHQGGKSLTCIFSILLYLFLMYFLTPIFFPISCFVILPFWRFPECIFCIYKWLFQRLCCLLIVLNLFTFNVSVCSLPLLLFSFLPAIFCNLHNILKSLRVSIKEAVIFTPAYHLEVVVL